MIASNHLELRVEQSANDDPNGTVAVGGDTKAVIEVIDAINANRTKFQKRLAALLAKLLSPAIKTVAPKMLGVLMTKRDELKATLAEVKLSFVG